MQNKEKCSYCQKEIVTLFYLPEHNSLDVQAKDSVFCSDECKTDAWQALHLANAFYPKRVSSKSTIIDVDLKDKSNPKITKIDLD